VQRNRHGLRVGSVLQEVNPPSNAPEPVNNMHHNMTYGTPTLRQNKVSTSIGRNDSWPTSVQ